MSRLRGPGKWIVLTDLAGLLKILFGFGIYSDLSIFILSKNNLDGVKNLIPYLIRPKLHSLAIFNGKLEELPYGAFFKDTLLRDRDGEKR